jgi:uncharacterized protein YndB with AHSA1/START domain
VWQPWPMQIEVARRIAAPAQRVWDVIADVAGSAERSGAIESLEILAGVSPVEVGTSWRETRTVLGRKSTQEMTVTTIDPGRSYSVRGHSAGTDYESTLSIKPQGPQTATLTISVEASTAGTAGRLMIATLGRVLAGATRTMLEHELADIASAAEPGPGSDTGVGDETMGGPAGR